MPKLTSLVHYINSHFKWKVYMHKTHLSLSYTVIITKSFNLLLHFGPFIVWFLGIGLKKNFFFWSLWHNLLYSHVCGISLFSGGKGIHDSGELAWAGPVAPHLHNSFQPKKSYRGKKKSDFFLLVLRMWVFVMISVFTSSHYFWFL